MERRYSIADNTLAQPLADVDSGIPPMSRVGSYADLPHVLAVKVAQANEEAARTTAHGPGSPR
jgi:hypothetical protein